MIKIKIVGLILVFGLLLLENNIYAQKPELVVQTGHASDISEVVFSPDSKLLVSSNRDLIKLWDIESGQELRTITEMCSDIVFQPDGKTIACISRTLSDAKGKMKSISFQSLLK